jgi:hypothetical protein
MEMKRRSELLETNASQATYTESVYLPTITFRKSALFNSVVVKEALILEPADIKNDSYIPGRFYPNGALHIGENNTKDNKLIGVRAISDISEFDQKRGEENYNAKRTIERMIYFGGKVVDREDTEQIDQLSFTMQCGVEETLDRCSERVYISPYQTLHPFYDGDEISRISDTHEIFQAYHRAQLFESDKTLDEVPWTSHARFKVKLTVITMPLHIEASS